MRAPEYLNRDLFYMFVAAQSKLRGLLVEIELVMSGSVDQISMVGPYRRIGGAVRL